MRRNWSMNGPRTEPALTPKLAGLQGFHTLQKKYRYRDSKRTDRIWSRRLCLQIGTFGFRPNRPGGAGNRPESGVDCGVFVAPFRLLRPCLYSHWR